MIITYKQSIDVKAGVVPPVAQPRLGHDSEATGLMKKLYSSRSLGGMESRSTTQHLAGRGGAVAVAGDDDVDAVEGQRVLSPN